jgi:radical SAM superfamily enzyme YgiQ (UPF0313 family)
MDVLLLTPVDPLAYQIIPDVGLMYLAGSLRDAGFSVMIKDCRRHGWDYGELENYIEREIPLVVGIKCHSNESMRVARMAEVIRRAHPGATIIVGGPHPSMDPEGVLADMPSVDYAFIGEGELNLPPFVRWVKAGKSGLLPESVQGVAFREDQGVTVRSARLEQDLDRLPPPAWDLMSPDTYPDEAAGIFAPAFPTAPMMISRGCPYGCKYCGSRYISGTRIRYRSTENILQEIDLLESRYGVRTFTFVDDNFTSNRQRAMALFEKLADRDPGISFTFPNGVRVDSLDPELLKLMEAAGCFLMGLGIESGSDAVLEMMGKKQTTARIRETVELVKRTTSIQMTGFFILGYPGETLADVEKTIQFAIDLPIHHAHLSQFMPIPHTPVYEEMLDKGWLDPERMNPELITNDKSPLNLPGLPSDRLLRLQRIGYLRFYARPWRIINFIRLLKSPGLMRVILRRFIKLFK